MSGPTAPRPDLDRKARALAVQLRELGLKGGRALLLYPPGLEFIAAFFGCLYAGVVAVPTYRPRLNRPMTRLRSIVADGQPCAVQTSAAQVKDAARWEAGVPEMRGVHLIATDVANHAELALRWADLHPGRDTLAFLQYTSGSTAAPKGVMVTHGNLIENSARIQAACGADSDVRGVFWLPLFHDTGLIGGVITLVPGRSSSKSDWETGWITSRRSSPAANSNASRSPARLSTAARS
jgi:acyl-CoA synthetase (AMP-forming)/AMP-acid ligase II